jgi:hypothetical protein
MPLPPTCDLHARHIQQAKVEEGSMRNAPTTDKLSRGESSVQRSLCSPLEKHEAMANMSELSRNDAVDPGGTANLAVLGGNLPPSRAHGDRTPFGSHSLRSAVGLVARQNGPVARSTQTPIESFRQNCRPLPGGAIRVAPPSEWAPVPPDLFGRGRFPSLSTSRFVSGSRSRLYELPSSGGC